METIFLKDSKYNKTTSKSIHKHSTQENVVCLLLRATRQRCSSLNVTIRLVCLMMENHAIQRKMHEACPSWSSRL